MRALQIAASRRGSRLLRNNVGMLPDPKRPGCMVRYGLCVGSSDLIGWTPLVVTPEMAGRKIAVFSAVEVKTVAGRATSDQRAFLAAVERDGGIAILARSESDLVGGMGEFGIAGW